ncbi:MAG: trypsin-like serine peptidase [Nakamurella sp.]
MTRSRFLRVRIALAATALLLVAAGWAAPSALADDPPAPPGTPTAHTIDGLKTVGPLFRNGLTNKHGCTASVVASPFGNLILTAAHCVSGTAAGWLFAPGYDAGATPYGVWTVTHAFVDPSWISSQDPHHDYAFLQVASQKVNGRRATLQSVTGGNLLGFAPFSRQRITDVAYNSGVNDRAISCTVPVYYNQGYPSFNCHGYVGGSSGSPWLASIPGSSVSFVDGVIGGLHQGGCFEYTSDSSPFGADTLRLLLRASFGVHPNTVPQAGSDGC